MTAVHTRFRELTATALDGSLGETERVELVRHVDRCIRCAELDGLLRRDAAALAVPMPVAPPPRVRGAIEARVAVPPIDPALLRTLRVAAAAAILLGGIVLLAIILALGAPRTPAPGETLEPAPAGLHGESASW